MDKLLHEFASRDPSCQMQAFNAMLQVLAHRTESGHDDYVKVPFPNEVLLHVLEFGMAISSAESAFLFDTLIVKAMEEYIDLKFYCYRNFGKLADQNCTSATAGRIFEILVTTNFPSASELKDGKKLSSACGLYREMSEMRKEHTNCWITLLSKLPINKTRKFLSILEPKILHNLNRPELLVSFLESVLSAGGVNSVLAMNAIFSLMRTYNVEFSNFYDKLYAMLSHEILRSPYRHRFLKSLNMFMSSTMIPAYVVAGFCKRLSRLALTCSPGVTVWIVSCIYNLLWHYPSCRILVHREDINESNDAYRCEEMSLARCKAMDSSLWELTALESHYWTRISRLASIFSDRFRRPPFDLDSLAEELDEICASETAQEELKHQWSRRPPTLFKIQDHLFSQ